MSRFLEQFILLNVEQDEVEEAEKDYLDKLQFFAAIHNPQVVSKTFKEYEEQKNPVSVPIPEQVIEWAIGNDYWIGLDISELLPLLEKAEEERGRTV